MTRTYQIPRIFEQDYIHFYLGLPAKSFPNCLKTQSRLVYFCYQENLLFFSLWKYLCLISENSRTPETAQRVQVCLLGDATGPRQRGKHISCQLYGTLTLLTPVMSTCIPVRFPPLHGTISPLTRFLFLRCMTGSLMSSPGVSFSDSVFPMPLRYDSSFSTWASSKS